MLLIHLFGGLRAERAGGPHPARPVASDALALPGAAARRLMALLIVERERTVARDTLAFALWPDSTEPRARGSLRLALHQLSAWLAPHLPPDDLIARTRTTLHWRAHPSVWIDVAAFEDRLRAVEHGRPDDDGRETALRAALALYSGDLLSGWDESWIAAPRAVARGSYERTLEALAASYETVLDHAAAARTWRRKLAVSPLDEGAYRGLARALALAGDVGEARAVCRTCEETLRSRLGQAPGAATTALCRAIAIGDLILPGEGGEAVIVPGARQESTAPAPPPIALNRFVGREAELASVCRELGTPGVLTVVGPGGAGKSRLTAEAAAAVVRAGERPAVWVDLSEAVEDVQVLDALARALGALPAPSAPLRHRVLEALAGRRAVVVLDNCEQARAPIATLVEELVAACPDATVLATSRMALGIAGERLVPLAGLALGEAGTARPEEAPTSAVALFMARMAQRWPSFRRSPSELGTVARICHLVDGLPLAIELAVARTSILGLAELADALESDIRVLRDATTARTPRHRTMDATIAWSYRLLAPEDREAFRRLSVLAGGFDPAAAAAVVGLRDGDPATPVLLERLAAHSLLQRDPGDATRHRMLLPIRHFALDALASAEGTASARERHARHFARLVDVWAPAMKAPERQSEAFDALEWDRSNLRAALVWLRESGPLEAAVDMAVGLTTFWFRRSHLEWERTYVESLLTHVAQTSQPPAGDFIALHRTLSLIAFRRGDLQEAVRRARLVAEYQMQIGDPARHLVALVDLTTFLAGLGQFGPALAAGQDACRLAEDIGDRSKLAEALQHSAMCHVRLGDWATARATYARCEAIARAEGLEMTNILLGRATLAQATAAYAESEALHRTALDRLEAIGDASGAARAHNNLGRLHNDMGRHGDAMASLRRALSAWRATGRRDLELFVLHNMGEVELRKGNLASAKLLLERCLALKREAGNAYSLAFTLLGAAELALALEDPALAAERLAEARAALASVDSRDVAAWADRVEAEARLASGDRAGARGPLQRALRTFDALGARRDVACALDLAARLALADGQPAEARRLAEVAGTLRAEIGAPRTAHERRAHEALEAALREGAGDAAAADTRAASRAWTTADAVASILAASGA